MANSFFELGERRSARVRDLFSKIASRYDLLNDLQSFGLHRYWKRRVIELADIRSGSRGLDLCCGTGDLALALARENAQVVGLDFSGPMLQVAQRRSSQSRENRSADSATGRGTLVFVQADAQRIPFAEDSFDIIIVGYGLRNLASWEKGLQEMARIAAPGARLLVLEFGKPANRLLRNLYFAYLKIFVPMLGYIFCADAAAYAYIFESLRHYPAQHEVAAKMRELELEQVEVHEFLGGIMSINCARKKCDKPAPATLRGESMQPSMG